MRIPKCPRTRSLTGAVFQHPRVFGKPDIDSPRSIQDDGILDNTYQAPIENDDWERISIGG